MKKYHYSFLKMVDNFWFLFLLPLFLVWIFFKTNFNSPAFQDIVILTLTIGLLLLISVGMLIPIIGFFILLKTEITINEKEIVQKNFIKTKKIKWADVVSIERKHFYEVLPDLDKPIDVVIKGKNKTEIGVYRFLKDFNMAEQDIKQYSKKEF